MPIHGCEKKGRLRKMTLLLPNFRRNAKASIGNSHYGKLSHAASVNDEAGGCSHNALHKVVAHVA
jgi:hypothetical protein